MNNYYKLGYNLGREVGLRKENMWSSIQILSNLEVHLAFILNLLMF